MFVELHILQSFAPSNLNRDDTGAPKDCVFGGARRARISSQAFKRAIRQTFRTNRLVPEEDLGIRTKRLVEEVADRLAQRGRPADEAMAVAEGLPGAFGIKAERARRGGSELETSYLVFLGERTVQQAAELVDRHWDTLADAVAKQDAKGQAKAPAVTYPADLARELKSLLDGEKSADIALFGRMLADLPEKNIDAACQVAHAVSTHAVDLEFDFYTAVDDIKNASEEADAGAGMMGTVEFNAACFYRYANVDCGQLLRNLQGDESLARKALEAFLRASVIAIPTGKQNSMAAQNPPFFVMVVVREAGLWNLANAFLRPVQPDSQADLALQSVAALDSYWAKLCRMYGADGVEPTVCALDESGLDALSGARVDNIDTLVRNVMGKVRYA